MCPWRILHRRGSRAMPRCVFVALLCPGASCRAEQTRGTCLDLHSRHFFVLLHNSGGTFSDTAGAVSCNQCPAGYACPPATGLLSVNNTCGVPTSFCPAGSPARTPTPPGAYASATSAGLFMAATPCEAGRFCVTGVATSCPAGRYGTDPGETSPACSGSCTRGYFCGPGSTSATQANCSTGPSYYCPEVRHAAASLPLCVH